MLYITTALLNPNHAQAIQILAMSEAFANLLPDRFLLVSPGVPGQITAPFPWRQVPGIFGSRSWRYAQLALMSPGLRKELSQAKIFTRDIGMAFLFNLLEADVTYEIHKDFSTRSGSWLLRWLGQRIKFIAISEALKAHITARYGVAEGRVLVAHDGVALEPYDRHRNTPKALLRQELGLPVDATIVMHTGSLYEGRGIELFEIILKAFPDLLCVSVGGQPADLQRWQQRFEAYPNMLFVGHQVRDVVVRYQMAADLLFFPMTRQNPIWWCASPLKLFEYMASGVPILGSAIGSSAEVIGQANAILFDSEQPQSIEAGVQLFLQDRDGALERASRSLEKVASSYTWRIRAECILRFIGEKTADKSLERPVAALGRH